MGLKSPYRVFESTVLGIYNLGRLDRTSLGALMEPYRDMTMDLKGHMGVRTHDGKLLEEVVIETWGLELPPNKPGDDADSGEWAPYAEALRSKMKEVTRSFNW